MIVLLWMACAEQVAPAPTPAPSPAPAERPAPAEQPAPPPTPTFQYEGWPGEGIPVITTLGPLDAPLHASPGGAASARCALPAGETVSWEGSIVRTEQPAPVRLSAPQRLDDAISYGPVDQLDRAAMREPPAAPGPAEVGPGHTVEHLAYRAEGWCFYRVDADVIGARCFHPTEQSARTSWWVQATCGASVGWLRVDDRDDLEIGRSF